MDDRTQLRSELGELYQKILRQGALVEEALNKAIIALSARDHDLARSVISGDAVVDRLQTEIEDEVTRLIESGRPPLADIRELLAVIKLCASLERIGDHARHMAKAVANLPEEVLAVAMPAIRDMAILGIGMVHDSLTAFVEHNPDKAREVAARDDRIDVIHKELYARLVRMMTDRPEWIAHGVDLMFLNRYLERLGDHVTNMCEWVVFSKTGVHTELNR